MNRYKLSKAGVDLRQGLERLGNNKEFYESMLKKFCSDLNFAQLRSALKQGKAEDAFLHAHALKGIAGNLSVVRLYDALVPLVEELRKGEMKNAPELFETVETAYEDFIEAMK